MKFQNPGGQTTSVTGIVVPGDDPTLLLDESPITVPVATIDSIDIDVSKYNSLLVYAQTPGGGQASQIRVGVEWQLGIVGAGEDYFQLESQLAAAVPCRGTAASITWTAIQADVPNCTIVVYGSARSFPRSIVDITSDEWGVSGIGTVQGSATDGFATWSGMMPANTSAAEFPPLRAGKALFTFTNNSTTSNKWSAWVADYETSTPIAPLLVQDTVTTYSESIEFVVPRRPINFHVNNESAAPAPFSATITYLTD